jgi:hypothetical protein
MNGGWQCVRKHRWWNFTITLDGDHNICQKWWCTWCVEMSIQYPLFNFHGLSKQNEMNSSSWWKDYNKLFSNIVEQKTNLHWHEPKHWQWEMVNIKFEIEDSNAWLSKICIRLWQLLKSSKALSPKPKPKLPSTTHSSSIITHKDMELKPFATWICKNTQFRWNPGRVEEYPSVVWSVFNNVQFVLCQKIPY